MSRVAARTAPLVSALIADDLLSRILPGAKELVVSDVEVIGQLAYLAAEIDLDEDTDERFMLEALNPGLWRLIGVAPQPIVPISPVPLDREERGGWLRELVPQLTSRDARELAYVAAYLVVVADLELAPIESTLLGELERALAIAPARASELAVAASRALTEPDVEPEIAATD
jgi:hypothetical protein